MDAKTFAGYIDHTNLRPDAAKTDIERLCDEAITYGFHSICINSSNIEYAKNILGDSSVKICSVAGFPLGASLPAVKAKETYEAVSRGAVEIDMVINIGELKNNNKKKVLDDIKFVVREANGHIVKVILETCYLSEEEIIAASLISKEAGAHYIKTSTGLGDYGARLDDLILMKNIAGEDMKVKAAGGIKNLKTALLMIDAGADRLGLSRSVEIIREIGSDIDR